MKRLKTLVFLLVCAAIFASAAMVYAFARNLVNYDKLTEIKLAYYGWGASTEYKLAQRDGAWLVSREVRGSFFEEDSYNEAVVGEEFVQKIKKILSDNEAQKWDGFDKSENYYDGGGFIFYAGFSDGKQINARGYMTEPYTFYTASRALSEQFSSLFE